MEEVVKSKGDAETCRLTLLSATEWQDVSESHEEFAKAMIPLSSGMEGQSCLASSDVDIWRYVGFLSLDPVVSE